MGGGVLDYEIHKVKRCTLGKERIAEEITGNEKHKGREKGMKETKRKDASIYLLRSTLKFTLKFTLKLLLHFSV